MRFQPCDVGSGPGRRVLLAVALAHAVGCSDTAAEAGSDAGAGDTAAPTDTVLGDDALGADVAPGDDVTEVPTCLPVTPAGASPQVSYAAEPNDGCHFTVVPGKDDQAAIMTAVVAARAGQTVCLGAGTFVMTGEVTIDTPDLVLRGASRDGTVLDFTGQKYGGNGISARGARFRVESLTVKNTPGDGVRASGVTDVVFRDVAVRWDAVADPKNGAYGLYPVQCNGVLIERCLVVGASDAGIYVGQSSHIRVVDSEAYGNVAAGA